MTSKEKPPLAAAGGKASHATRKPASSSSAAARRVRPSAAGPRGKRSMIVVPPVRRQVAVFGAGIAGLTAAHELIERGYEVEVYEAAAADPVQEGLYGEVCAVGGLARTRWASIPQPDREQGVDRLAAQPIPRIRFKVIGFAAGSAALDTKATGRIEEIAEQLAKLSDDREPIVIEVWGFTREPDGLPPYAKDFDPASPPEPDERLDCRRAWVVANELHKARPDKVSFTIRGMGLGRAEDWTCPASERDYVDFHLAQDIVPGEHGFRFFPSCYRNLFDTMSRTPVADERSAVYYETPRTVLDNIVAVDVHCVARKKPKKSCIFSRRPATSLQEIFNVGKELLEAMGCTPADIARHQVKLFKYMTSCRERRAREYEYQSWLEFMEGERFSPDFQRIFDTTGQITLAARARECDARTYGNMSVQLFLNQVLPATRIDATLNGPTSLAWLNHWRRYLETQGVEFHRGKLERFVIDPEGKPRPVVRVTRREVKDDPPYPTLADHPTVLMRDYYVVAIPLADLREIVDEEPALRCPDFDKIRDLDLGDTSVAQPTGMLRHLRGVQYFLQTDGGFVRGHTNYIDSPWALSSIAQPQFWLRKRGWWDGYRGLLSVDIGNWHTAGEHATTKVAWEATGAEIANEVWEQVRATVADRTSIPDSFLAYCLDTEEEHENGDGEGAEEGEVKKGQDDDAYLVTRPGEYPTRPGRLDSRLGYEVHFGNLVLAGTHMATYTRLTSMEAANESGRHAVNGILQADAFHGARCQIWDPEDHEPVDLTMLKDLDRKLLELGLPHFVDILELREVPAAMLGGEAVTQVVSLVGESLKGT